MSDALDNARAALAEPRTGDKHELIGQVATLRSALRDLIAEHERLTAPPADDERGTPVEGVARAVRDWFAEVSEAAGFRRRGPVADAEVLAALNAYDPRFATTDLADYASEHVADMRAALAAALRPEGSAK